LALALLAADEAAGISLGTDAELKTSGRLIETTDAVRFEFTGPASVAPTVAIDVNRNGVIDRNVDFKVGVRSDGSSPCLQNLLGEGRSSICRSPGDKAQLTTNRHGNSMTTVITLQKRGISADGFGFGFSAVLWNRSGDFENLLASGDYQFGGSVEFVRDRPNFMGEQNPNLPPQIMPAIHRYEGCLKRSMKALEPLDRTKIPSLKAVPASCMTVRAAMLDEGVEALVALGAQKTDATDAMRRILDAADLGIDRMVQLVEEATLDHRR